VHDTRRKKPRDTTPERRHIGVVPVPAGQAAASGWIVSAFWDSVLFIGAPVTCILALFPLRRYWSSQEYSFLLLAFFTFGHHLPGFIRTYGDRELFARYRLRFLLAPPLIFLTTLWFDLRGRSDATAPPIFRFAPPRISLTSLPPGPLRRILLFSMDPRRVHF